jgi:tetratricopeptide (TPR) repeat protein
LELSEAASSTTGAIFAIENLLALHYGWRGEYAAGTYFLEAQLLMPYLAASEYISSGLRVLRADCLSRLGQFPRALAIMREEVLLADRRLAQGTISAVGHAHILSYTGQLEAELGDHDAARTHLEVALARHEQAETPPDAAELMVNRAYGALLRPRTGTGVRLAADEAELRRGLDLTKRAIEMLRKGAAWIVGLARAHRMAAELSLALGQPDAALADSAAALRAMGAIPYAAEEFLFTHSRALQAVGREAEAEEHLRWAYHRVLLVASRTEDAELQRSWLEDVRTNREIVARWERLNQAA